MSGTPFEYNEGLLILSPEDHAVAVAMDGWTELDIARLLHQLSEQSREEIRAAVASILSRAADGQL
jgi:hypothetical protein